MRLWAVRLLVMLLGLFVLTSCGGGANSVGGNGNAATPHIAVTDSDVSGNDHQLSFGSVAQGSMSPLTVTVANNGSADLLINAIASNNTLTAPFSIFGDNCSNQTIAPSGTCTVIVQFEPGGAGPFSDSFDIPSNDPDTSTVTINVTGAGTAVPVPNIAVNNLEVAFGSVVQNLMSDQTVTITNTGNADLLISSIASNNTLTVPFSITGAANCTSQPLAPAETCSFTARFAPTGTGAFADSFDILNNDPDTPSITITIGGTGMAAPAPNIAVTDPSAPYDDHQISFGNVVQGAVSAQTITATNAGTANLVIGAIASNNTLTVPFSIAEDNCSGKTIAPSANCTVRVQFAPTELMFSTDSFDMPSNDPDNATITITVTGTGIVAPIPQISVTDSVNPSTDHDIPFGNVTEADFADQTVTFFNTGTGDLVIGSIANATPLAAPFTITANSCSGKTVAPGASCVLIVRFAPAGTGAFTAGFDVPSNDPAAPSVIVSVNGTGITGTRATANIPETGQTTCYDADGVLISCATTTGAGQDAALLKGVAWPGPRFTAGAGGEADCITDNLTGLVWAKNGYLPAATKTWQQALDYVAAMNSGAGLCGLHDWRLPNKNELRSIANYGQTSGIAWLTNAAQGFTNVKTVYWSSTTYGRTIPLWSDYAWSVNMVEGHISITNKIDSKYLWPVRAGQNSAPAAVPRTGQTTCYNASGTAISCLGTGQDGEWLKGVAWPNPRFTTNSDTTMTDNLTGVTWSPSAHADTFTGTTTCTGGGLDWQESLDYIACLNANNYLGHNDWRLPNVNELETMNNAENCNAYWPTSQGFTNVQDLYWTSDTKMGTYNAAWVVQVLGATAAAFKSSSYSAWPVRGGR